MAIPILPDDIINEIFLRLPAKSLLRFTSLSKSWGSTISSSDFRKKHRQFLKKSVDNKRILLRTKGKFKHCSLPCFLQKHTVDAFDADFSVDSSMLLYIGSCDGLICLAVENTKLILWNPSTRESKNLPVFDSKLRISFNHCGFGYDPSSDDYKVVIFQLISFVHPYFDYSVQIYSLKTNQWKSIIENYEPEFCVADTPVTCANGKFYWINQSKSNDCMGSTDPETGAKMVTPGWYIGYLDLETEKYGLLKKPNSVAGGVEFSLFASEGCLYALCSHYTRDEFWLVGSESWTKVATIAKSQGYRNALDTRIVYVVENGEILLNCGPHRKFVIFNPKDSSFRCPDIRNYNNVRGRITYVESFVSPSMW